MTTSPNGFVLKSDLAYGRIRESILSGRYPAGTVINQELIAQEIGISTTPVREALRRLNAEGLIELDAHRDARIAPLTEVEARDLSEVRQTLCGLAGELAAQRRTDDDLAAMEESAARMQPITVGADEGVLLAHRDFHRAVYHASHNEVLIMMLDDLWDKSDRYRRLALELSSRQETLRPRDHNEHFAIMDLVRQQDVEGAGELMRKHVRAPLDHAVMVRLAEEDQS